MRANRCVLLAFLAFAPVVRAEDVTEAEALAIGTDAYIYGYPLVTMEMTRRVMTSVPAPDLKVLRAPMGQFIKARAYPDASYRDVTAPNADTLYSVAWLDVSKEPHVLALPDMGDRYYLMPMLSGWTDVFASPGKRTTGGKAANYLIAGPGWSGTAPAGMTVLRSPTAIVWVLGRTYCTGTPEDFAAVHALMDQYSLTPLSAFGKPYTPPASVPVDPSVNAKTAPREQVDGMDAARYFRLLAALMEENPPAAADAPLLARMARVGIVPGKDFDLSKLDPAVAAGLAKSCKAGLERILVATKHPGKEVNGWQFTFTGDYGTEYLFRAAVTLVGLGANLAKDACYPMTSVDSDGKALDGAQRYTIRFEKGHMPPVNGFWSLTMYDADYFFVANRLSRYTLSARNAFRTEPDGSVELYIQRESPGADKEANWLPAPAGPFHLMLRLYWPQESFLGGSWAPPAVRRVIAQ
ncbi:MAG: DUF1254 domain-containing protein [Planctomycetes bacterium]|nr:DUF1254 domain-containing protein [Planctomycetota bacterium]